MVFFALAYLPIFIARKNNPKMDTIDA